MSPVVPLVAAFCICHLEHLEHGRSVKPSTSLITYLSASIVCHSFVIWSLYLHHVDSNEVAVHAASIGLEFVLLALESISKRSYLRGPYKTLPIEQTVSDLNRTFLVWVNALIRLGNLTLLTYNDLPKLDDGLKSRNLRALMESAWDKTCKHFPFHGEYR